MKLMNIPKKLFEHKKKAIFGSLLLSYGGIRLSRWKSDCDIRRLYAYEALKYGVAPLKLDGKPRRVYALLDPACASAFDNFKKNALPLLNLAGLQVELIKPTDRANLESIAAAIDETECDTLYLIGNDSGLSVVLTAMIENNKQSVMPIGFFPATTENRCLLQLTPNIFCSPKDIRPFCESAMAVIENCARNIHISRTQLEVSEENGDVDVKKSCYGLSGLQAGWFDRAETRKTKMWYFGGLKRIAAYFSSMLRCFVMMRYPILELSLECEKFCGGCSKCRKQEVTAEQESSWWQKFFGSYKYQKTSASKVDFSNVTNENCGEKFDLQLKTSEIMVDCQQKDDDCGMRVRAARADASRLQLFGDAWRRYMANIYESPTATFYNTNLLVKSALIKFSEEPPPYLNALTLDGTNVALEQTASKSKTIGIRLEATDKVVQVFLPSKLRF